MYIHLLYVVCEGKYQNFYVKYWTGISGCMLNFPRTITEGMVQGVVYWDEFSETDCQWYIVLNFFQTRVL